ncbi:CG4363 [Drosophila busckii]|uniref:CG4363 n=1 Tax=Drosophila busckii TaxID=30019 RepID=A0A0M5IXB1_DROBS|nr:uncharacterized protein LOC108595017 [Drosophila busckii]ALC40956.1 CG4363 [Drosophila busckii]
MRAQAIYSVALLVLSLIGLGQANTIASCNSCYGINCQRTSLQAQEQKCADSLDYCVTIFDDSKVMYKGCSLEIPLTLRQRCESHSKGSSCFKCNSDRCNNVGAMDYACVQCDASKDANCAENASTLQPTRCVAPTGGNSYCYVKSSGSSTQRGCATTVAEQQSCLKDANCLLCSPGDIRGCNAVNISNNSNVGNRFIRFLR